MSNIRLNTPSNSKVLTLDNINPFMKSMDYAVRGPLFLRSLEVQKELAKGIEKPFKNILFANIGDAQALGQKPITFIRQVLSLISYPELIDKTFFPSDVKEKAEKILASCSGKSVGSYSDSVGVELIREHVAKYITKRDGGILAHVENIILCNGATEGIRACLKMFKVENGMQSGIMIPIPQYPLYSASIQSYGLVQIDYYLDENRCWALDIEELERSFKEAKSKCNPRAIVVINPGNPTGQVLTRKNIEQIIKFAHSKRLFILADEVYQHNVYDKDSEFHSFKKVMMEMGEPYMSMELASFFSTAKGYMGECGLRGGYWEVINLDHDVKTTLLKSISATLSPNHLGQVAMDCVVDPPKEGDPSFDLFIKEKTDVLNSLASRAHKVIQTFNGIKGFKCNPVQGAMYAFPKIEIPIKAIEAAKEKGVQPDAFYALELLESTGICVVPGSGFGQVPGTYHYRTTILPQPELLDTMLDKFKLFHEQFLKKYA